MTWFIIIIFFSGCAQSDTRRRQGTYRCVGRRSAKITNSASARETSDIERATGRRFELLTETVEFEKKKIRNARRETG